MSYDISAPTRPQQAQIPNTGDPNLATAQAEQPGAAVPSTQPVHRRSERGQSTAEYALLVLGVATIALVVLAWAGSTGAIGSLFDRVIEWVSSKVV